jgi:hypothetical protein
LAGSFTESAVSLSFGNDQNPKFFDSDFFSINSTGNSRVLTFSKTETRENQMPHNISCRIFEFYKSSFKIVWGNA